MTGHSPKVSTTTFKNASIKAYDTKIFISFFVFTLCSKQFENYKSLIKRKKCCFLLSTQASRKKRVHILDRTSGFGVVRKLILCLF